MSVNITWPVDEILLNQLSDQGWTTFKLFVANSAGGPYTDSGVTPDPATISAALTVETYTFTFSYGAGGYNQWGKVVPANGGGNQDLNLSAPFPFGGGITLEALRRELVKETRIGFVGVASGSTSSTCTTADQNLIRWPDDHFDDWILYSPETDEYRLVTDWSVSAGTGTFTVTPDWTTGPSDTESIEVINKWTPEELRDALNWGIYTAYPRLFREIVNTSVRTAAGQFQYEIPSDIRVLSTVEIESFLFDNVNDVRKRGHPWTQVPFRRIQDGMREKIEIEQYPVDDRRLRFIGTGVLNQLYNNSDQTELVLPQASIVVYYAAFRLYSSLVNDNQSQDIDRYSALAQHYWGLAQQLISSFTKRRPAQKMWGAEARGSRKYYGGVGSLNPHND